jgi:hypothetical protein
MVRHLELVMAETGFQPSVSSRIWERLISADFARSRERRIDAGLPQIGRFEHVRVRQKNRGQHRHLLSDLIAGSTFGNRPIAVKVGAVSDPCPAAVKVGLGSTRAEPRRHANGRNRRNLAVRPRAGEGQESTAPGGSTRPP